MGHRRAGNVTVTEAVVEEVSALRSRMSRQSSEMTADGNSEMQRMQEMGRGKKKVFLFRCSKGQHLRLF